MEQLVLLCPCGCGDTSTTAYEFLALMVWCRNLDVLQRLEHLPASQPSARMGQHQLGSSAYRGRVDSWQLVAVIRKVLITCNCWQWLPSSRTGEPSRLDLLSLGASVLLSQLKDSGRDGHAPEQMLTRPDAALESANVSSMACADTRCSLKEKLLGLSIYGYLSEERCS